MTASESLTIADSVGWNRDGVALRLNSPHFVKTARRRSASAPSHATKRFATTVGEEAMGMINVFFGFAEAECFPERRRS